MLLVLTNSQDATADYLLPKLRQRGIDPIRLDTDTLVDRSIFTFDRQGPRFRLEGRWHAPGDFHVVWYRRPERLQASHLTGSPDGEYILDEWGEIVEGFLAHIPEEAWVNHPAHNSRASSKLEQLTTAQQLGLEIPDTLVTQDPETLRQFFHQHGGEAIVKPMASGQVRREPAEADTLVYTNQVLENDLLDLSDLSRCPTLFQALISKTSDIRITIVDSEIHAVKLLATDADGRQRCDIRRNNMNDVTYQSIALPANIQSQLQCLMQRYELRFAAIDMVVDQQGSWYFLEINPNGQWAWLDLEGVTNIAESFARSFSP
ncbi:hypothetical protein [Aeoliella sp.]|uniref:hypothetical protein n=1 Tax=Aeoliella sp. TaxID=2795800 RepID=UPI003CCC3F74